MRARVCIVFVVLSVKGQRRENWKFQTRNSLFLLNIYNYLFTRKLLIQMALKITVQYNISSREPRVIILVCFPTLVGNAGNCSDINIEPLNIQHLILPVCRVYCLVL